MKGCSMRIYTMFAAGGDKNGDKNDKVDNEANDGGRQGL
jgi:hypothetical protein